jgi:DNA mismatch endonuclease (patch repair protein)
MKSKKRFRQYPRLGPPPPSSSKVTTKVMKANRPKDTGPELIMRRTLRDIGLLGYRLNWKKVPGRPDISYPRHKIAIFINGCFWHRCPRCNHPLPKTHTDFWRRKFERNKERDKRKRKTLEKIGWKVFEFWECDVKKNPYKCAKIIKDYASRTKV